MVPVASVTYSREAVLSAGVSDVIVENTAARPTPSPQPVEPEPATVSTVTARQEYSGDHVQT